MSIGDGLLDPRIARRVAELERINAELTAALRERTEAQAHIDAHFRASFESAAVGQVHYDPINGHIIRANRTYAAMLGYEPEELVGRLGSDFTWPEDKSRENYSRMLTGATGAYAREKRYLRRDGTPVWGRVSASLVRSPETGEPLLAVAVVEDIDEGHRAQAALAQAKQDLEATVAQRTDALAQRDLLLREVYHRVKNNLQIIDSMALMQARRLSDPAAKSALETLRRRVYALSLVHQQLMGSADLETFDIAPFLNELSSHLVEGVGHGKVALSVKAAPLKVGLDVAIPLGLLVTELVTNSIKHAFGGRSGRIEVALEQVAPGEVVLRVADDGCGYDPAAPGAQSSVGTSIIEGLVRQLNGVLTVTADHGTTSLVWLPSPVRT